MYVAQGLFAIIFQKYNLLHNNTCRLCSTWFLSLAIFKWEIKQTISNWNRIPFEAWGQGHHLTLGSLFFFFKHDFKIMDTQSWLLYEIRFSLYMVKGSMFLFSWKMSIYKYICFVVLFLWNTIIHGYCATLVPLQWMM